MGGIERRRGGKSKRGGFLMGSEGLVGGIEG